MDEKIILWLLSIIAAAGLMLLEYEVLRIFSLRKKEADESEKLWEQVDELRTICGPPRLQILSKRSPAVVYLLIASGESDPDERGYWIARAMNYTYKESKEAKK